MYGKRNRLQFILYGICTWVYTITQGNNKPMTLNLKNVQATENKFLYESIDLQICPNMFNILWISTKTVQFVNVFEIEIHFTYIINPF